MRLPAQVAAITWMGLATLRARLGAALVIVVGIAGVVGVFVALLAMRDGFTATLAATGRPDEAIVLRAGANSELSSRMTREDVTLVAQGAGVLRGTRGLPLASAEVVVVVNAPKKSTGTDANVAVRGVGPLALELRPHLRLVEGRPFTAGRRELMVGSGAERQFAGFSVGSVVTLNQEPWTVVGRFTSGDAHESEVWGDAEAVQSAYRRDGFQSVRVKLTSERALAAFKTALTADPRLKVDVERSRDYYATQSARLRRLIDFLATTVATIMAIGATFGALNTMYTAISTRDREIATLRAIGFSATAVVCAVLLEAIVLALGGGMLGAAIAWAVFDHYTVSTLGANFSQVVFAFDVSPGLVLQALYWALAIGVAGGLLPAISAARRPLTAALRAA